MSRNDYNLGTKTSANTSHTRTIGQDADKAFWCGNERHWYCGDTMRFWNGSLPAVNDPERADKLKVLQGMYFSYNLIAECIERNVASLVAKPFTFSISSPSGAVESDQPKQDLNDWLTWVNQFSNSQNAEWGSPWHDAVLNAMVDGIGTLRVWTPKRFELVEEIKHKLALHSPLCASISRELDDDDLLDSITYTDGGDGSETHFHWLYSDKDIPSDAVIVNVFELMDFFGIAEAYERLLEEGQVNAENSEAAGAAEVPEPAMMIRQQLEPGTLVVKLEDGENGDTRYMVFPELKGKWLIHQICMPSLVTESVKRCQASCNLALTSLNINLDKSGNRIRWLINALRPGDFRESTDNPGTQEFVPDESGLKVSPNNVNFVGGIPMGDASSPTLTTPSIFLEDPINVDLFESTISLFRQIMYDLFGQGFVMASGDGSASGVARVQIKSDFGIKIERYKELVESAFSGILTSVLRMLSPEYSEYTVHVSLRIWLGALLPDEAKEIREQFKEGLLSRSSAISRLNQSDNALEEIETIEQDSDWVFRRAKELAELEAISQPTLLKLSRLFDDAAAMAEVAAIEDARRREMEATAAMMVSDDGDGGSIDDDDNGDDDDDEG